MSFILHLEALPKCCALTHLRQFFSRTPPLARYDWISAIGLQQVVRQCSMLSAQCSVLSARSLSEVVASTPGHRPPLRFWLSHSQLGMAAAIDMY